MENCSNCQADLTKPNTVVREYISKEDGGGSVFAEGHYPDGEHFESDNFDGFGGDNYDLPDNSDKCIECKAEI